MLNIPRWQVWGIVAITVLGILFSMPNVVPQSWLAHVPNWLAHNRLSLGLDLQGGAYFLLEVDVRGVLLQRTADHGETCRTELRSKNIQVAGVGPARIHPNSGLPEVTIDLRPGSDREKAMSALRALDSGWTIAADPSAADRILVSMTEQAARERRKQVLDQSIEVVRRRVDETGTKDPSIQRQGDDRILVQLPGLNDPAEIERLLNKTAKMNFHLVNEDVGICNPATSLPANTMCVPTREGMEELRRTKPEAWKEIIGNKGLTADQICRRWQPHCLPILRQVIVSGENLIDSQATFDQQQGQPIVSFRFDGMGGQRFCRITTQEVGKRLAIVLDNEVISAPVIRGAICGGSGIITGSFTTQQTQELATLLRAGALPATLDIVERRTVGPDLGADSIRAGAIALFIGYMLIAGLIVVSYGFFGLLANICLLLNVLFTIAIMSALGATLTLPGIAGIVLGLAMAVDANVLVFERMREETRAGRTPISAIDASFRRAYVTITDSNLTTLFAAVFLYALGSGPIRGFAVTLALGILCSMFTAVTVSRIMIALWVRSARPRELPI